MLVPVYSSHGMGERSYLAAPVALPEGCNHPDLCTCAGRFHAAAAAAGSHEVFTWGGPGDQSHPRSPAEAEDARLLPLVSRCPYWRPSGAEPVLQLPVQEVELLAKRHSIVRLLERLPPTLRQGLRDTDPEGERVEGDAFRVGSSEVRLWRVRLPVAVQQVACGAMHTLVSLVGGGVMAWGNNTWGQVGGDGPGEEWRAQRQSHTRMQDGLNEASSN